MSATLPLPRREIRCSEEPGSYFRIKDIYIPTRDGSELCADLFLPLHKDTVRSPCLLSLTPYGKDIPALSWGLPNTDIYANMYRKIPGLGPDACYEAIDPARWV